MSEEKVITMEDVHEQLSISKERDDELREGITDLLVEYEGQSLNVITLVKLVDKVAENKIEAAYVMNRIVTILIKDNYNIED